MHNNDWFGDILMFTIAVLLIGVIVGIPALFYYDYNMEQRCINTRNLKSEECFALFKIGRAHV